MDKYIGRLLDNRYEILEVIGTGGMAVVYKARCHRLNRLVAIKILKDDYMEDEEFRRRFHSESQAVAMLSHPNIVSVYDVSTSLTADYIVMELIDGITLKQYMEKKGVLNWKETLHFAVQIGKALEHAHGRGIVHRDIKPHNVMVLKNGSVKVTDFGIARMMSKGNTLTKEALGSVHYISPEQAKGGRVDNRSDIYSLGVVMYEMMTGRPPYDGESPVSVAIQHINGGAVMPSTLNPNIPGGLEQIIVKAMAHEPSQRYSSATQMLTDMDEFRKNPAILFDYNTPPIDAVTMMPKPAANPEEKDPVSTAERVERKSTGERRSSGRPAGSRSTPRRRPDAREEAQRNKTATIAIIACSAVMVIAIAIFLVVLFGSGTDLVDVPNLVGQVYEDLPQYDDFTVKIDQEVHDEAPAGVIIGQTPNAGDEVGKDIDIYVVISLGPAVEAVYMPDLTQWELSQAERSLNNLSMNLQLKVEEEYHETVPQGSVIRTDPKAETELTAGQEITLYVSLGMQIKTSVMPDVVGDKRDSAVTVLNSQNLNLDIQVEEINDSKVETGVVISTDPKYGEELKTGQTVTVYVSIGPKLTKMPNVVGMSIGNAYSVLNTAGFETSVIEYEYVDSDEDKDTVVSQSVEKNTEVDVNTQITLEVSRGSAKTAQKTITIALPAGMEGCKVTVMDSNSVPVAEVTAEEGQNQVTVTLEGTGKQTYTVCFESESGEKMYSSKEVDFGQ